MYPVIAYMEFGGLAAAAGTLVIMMRHGRRLLGGEVSLVLIMCLVTILVGHLVTGLEWLYDSPELDRWGDSLSILIAVFWGIFLYSWIHYTSQAALRAQRELTDDARSLLAEKQRHIDSILNNVAGTVYRCRNDRHWTMEFISSKCMELTEYAPDELIGNAAVSYGDLIHPDDRDVVWEEVQEAMNARRPFELQYRLVTRSGRIKQVREQGAGVFDARGALVALEGFVQDTTIVHRLSQKLAYNNVHDPLTGLLNRRGIESRIREAINRAREDQTIYGLAMFDLDQFKVINESCGPAAGDQLLREVGGVIGNQVRRGDSVARLGGDEFAILFDNCSPESLRDVTGKVARAIEDYRFTWNERNFQVTASGGCLLIDELAGSADKVMRQVDEYCNAAKDLGRSRVYYYDDADESVARRHDQIAGISLINRAFENDAFRLYYQPIVPLTAGAGKESIEILLRMRSDGEDTIPPGVFIPAAERYGLVARLDMFVVDRVLDWLKLHRDVADRLGHCAVNLSGASFTDTRVLAFLADRLERAGDLAGRICFEITETAAVSNLSTASRVINLLRSLGPTFALDDFGSGASSFSYLRNLNVEFIKIDGQFVRDVTSDAVAYESVVAIHRVARALGKQTIAEFVENEAIAGKLCEIGVDYGQGYFFAKPRPVDQLIAGAG